MKNEKNIILFYFPYLIWAVIELVCLVFQLYY